MAMTVIELDSGHEGQFVRHIMKDPKQYYFYIVDWLHERKSSRFYLAMESRRIAGIMLIYRGTTVQFRGSNKAINALMGALRLKEFLGLVPVKAGHIILRDYTSTVREEMHMLHLRKGHERLHTDHVPVKLDTKDAGQVVDLLKAADPRVWSNQTRKMVEESIRKNIWVGIRDGNRVAAVGMGRVNEVGAMVHTIATHKSYRNRGFATSIVSALVERMLMSTDDAFIHVFKTNGPAYHVYRKVGFRPCRKLLFLKGARRKAGRMNRKQRKENKNKNKKR